MVVDHDSNEVRSENGLSLFLDDGDFPRVSHPDHQQVVRPESIFLESEVARRTIGNRVPIDVRILVDVFSTEKLWTYRLFASRCCVSILCRYQISQTDMFPSLRHAVDGLRAGVAGKAEPDEPLAVNLSCCPFENCNPPPVILDEVIVGGEYVGDVALCFERRYRQLNTTENRQINMRNT